MDFEILDEYRIFDGKQLVVQHPSRSLDCSMTAGVYVPPGKGPFPVLVYLSGLTCTWENATTKAAFQQAATKHHLIIVTPDTSPRGEGVPDDENFALGQGAGFYLNATQEPWRKNFRMYDYITADLILLIKQMDINADLVRLGIMGHSMGGCGALSIALK
ncbi:MAG: alpha/beta hydrolase-fold protein, partial [Pseudomonadota bacterium]